MNKLLLAGCTKLEENHSCFMSIVLFLSFLKYHFYCVNNSLLTMRFSIVYLHVTVVPVYARVKVCRALNPTLLGTF